MDLSSKTVLLSDKNLSAIEALQAKTKEQGFSMIHQISSWKNLCNECETTISLLVALSEVEVSLIETYLLVTC